MGGVSVRLSVCLSRAGIILCHWIVMKTWCRAHVGLLCIWYIPRLIGSHVWLCRSSCNSRIGLIPPHSHSSNCCNLSASCCLIFLPVLSWVLRIKLNVSWALSELDGVNAKLRSDDNDDCVVFTYKAAYATCIHAHGRPTVVSCRRQLANVHIDCSGVSIRGSRGLCSLAL